MSPARKRPRRPWYHRLHPFTWALVVLVVLASLSLVVGPWMRQSGRTASGAIQVQVLNGSNVRGLAARVAEYLRDQGLDVVSVGNADSHAYVETLVLLRRGDVETAHRVARALGAGTALEQRDPTLLVDVTIILGDDYEVPPGGAAPTDAAEPDTP